MNNDKVEEVIAIFREKCGFDEFWGKLGVSGRESVICSLEDSLERIFIDWALDEKEAKKVSAEASKMSLFYENMGPVGNGRLKRCRFHGTVRQLTDLSARTAK